MGPAPADVFTQTKAADLFGRNGFVEEKTVDAGAHHYGIIFKKNNGA
jgi:hypothetical protein